MLTIKDKKIKKINDTMAVYRFHDKGIIGSLSKLEHVNANIFNSQLLYDYLNLTKNAKNNLSNRIKILKRRKNRLIFIFYISYPFSKISSFFFKKK